MRNAEKTKERLLQAAEAEFSQSGFSGARVDVICREANVNKRMVYAYFGSKEKLYTAVLHNLYQRLAHRETALLEEYQNSEDTERVIEAIIADNFQFLKDNPSFVRMLMRENLDQIADLSVAMFEKTNAMNLLRRAIERGMASGQLKADLDVDQVLLTLTTLCFSYFSNIHSMSILMKTDFTSDEQIEKRERVLTQMMLSYLRKQEEQRS